MKKQLTSLVLSLIFVTGTALANDPVKGTTYQVDAKGSSLLWTGSKITGSSHSGTISISAGTLTIGEGAIVGGEFSIDMTTITNTDLSGGMKGKLEGHLKSEDFFAVEKFPAATLVITGSDSHGGHMHVMGELTIKGATHPVKFDANVSEKDGMLTASAEITFDRTKYDVRYGSKSFFDDLGNKAINDEVMLSVKLSAKKQ